MTPGLLVLSMATGIVWVDTGHRLSAGLVFACLSLAVVLATALLRQVGRDRVELNRGPDARRTRSWLGTLAAMGLAFLAGAERLEFELSDARQDTEWAHRALGGGIRIAQARVASRRTGRFGDEIELVSVRAVDGQGRLPSSLLLRLGESATTSIDGSTSRADRLLWPGAWVRLGLHVAPLRARRNPGAPDRAHQRARRGQAARARLAKPDWVLGLSNESSGRLDIPLRMSRARGVWRQRVARRLEHEGRAGAIVRALGLGDRGAIQAETRDAFRRLGLSHLLAVSGLHVGFVAGLAGWLFLRASVWLAWPGVRPWLFDCALGIACVAAASYAWITGAGISVERAALLFALYTVCRLFSRSPTPAAALSWVAIGILWMQPAALFELGAQLSFGACATLIVGGFWSSGSSLRPKIERESRLLTRILATGFETFRASLAISLGIAPLLAQAGLSLSLLAPLVNVLAIPWLGGFVLPSSLLAVAFSPALPDAAFSALMLPARGLEGIVVGLAKWLPEVSHQALLPLPLLVLACALALFWVRRGQTSWGVGLWIAIALAGAVPHTDGRRLEPPPRVVFFEMGQGDASLVQGREAVLLIDSGPGPPDASGGRELVRGLRAMGVEAIDVLAVTHGDLDHRAGARRVLASFPVVELWLPGAGRDDEALNALARRAQVRGTRVRWLSRGSRGTDRGDLTIEVLWPASDSSPQFRSRNDRSLVLRVVLDGMAFLFTADVGVAVERELMLGSRRIASDVLKVGHHGSRHSSSASFLDAVGASVVVVSAPCDATRGLPNRATLTRLQDSGAALWWTGRDGAILASRSETGGIAVEGWGPVQRCERP